MVLKQSFIQFSIQVQETLPEIQKGCLVTFLYNRSIIVSTFEDENACHFKIFMAVTCMQTWRIGLPRAPCRRGKDGNITSMAIFDNGG